MRIASPAAVLVAVAALFESNQAGAAESAIELHAKGFQVYVCEPSQKGAAWRLKGPDAVLSDGSGALVGHHFDGPTWQAVDGSSVVGEAVAASPAPQPGAISWLVLRATSHAGSGIFASVTYIARTNTEGGLAPATGCNAAHKGAESRVAYSATYVLFPQP